MYITCTATASLPLCQSIPAYHSNSGSTCTLRVLPLHHYPSVRVSQHTTVTLAVCVHYVYITCTATTSLPLCQSIPAYHSNSGSTCTLRVMYTYCQSYKVKCREGLRMLLLLHAIILCLHTQNVIHLCGSVNSKLRTIYVMLLVCHCHTCIIFTRHFLHI